MALPGENDDIDQWVEQLAGRWGVNPSAKGAPEGPAEVRVLREVLAHRSAHEREVLDSTHGLQASEDHALQRLRFRLKREGLLSRPVWRRLRWLPAVAAAMLLAVAGVRLHLPEPELPHVAYAFAYEEPPRYRGAVSQVPVRVDKPVASARQLAAALEKLGAQPRLYVWQGEAIVDFEATPATWDALQKDLPTLILPADARHVGLNRLVFSAR